MKINRRTFLRGALSAAVLPRCDDGSSARDETEAPRTEFPMLLLELGGKYSGEGALEAAARLGLEFGGWAPHGWLAEKPLGAIPEAYRAAMREYPDHGSNAQNYRERTKANVRDSHATLILVEKLPIEGGTKLTRDFAALIRHRTNIRKLTAAVNQS